MTLQRHRRCRVQTSRRPRNQSVVLFLHCTGMTPPEGHMAIHIDRREFIATVGGAAAAWPLAAAFALATAVSLPALAQDWPARPVRIVVPYAPGGSTDTVARLTADRLSRIWGQQVVIENKPGGGTNTAAAAVASSDPDGYTIFIGSSSLVTSRLLYRSLPYAPSDLAPVTLVCTFPLLLLVPNSSPARSVAEFIAFARGNKGKVTFASPGVGTVPHMAGRVVQPDRGHRDDACTVSGRCSRAHGHDRRAGRSADRRQRDARADQERPGSRTCGHHRQAQPVGAGLAERCGGGRARFRRNGVVCILRSGENIADDRRKDPH